jgi:acetoacetyl-CoA synthetase
MAQNIDSDRPVYGIRSQAFENSKSPVLSLEDLASHYLREIDDAEIKGPLAILGYSFGGLVAFEIARQLLIRGAPAAFVGLLDTWLPWHLTAATAQSHSSGGTTRRWHRILRHVHTFAVGPDSLRYFRETVISKVRVMAYSRIVSSGRTIPSWFRDVNDLNLMVASRYAPLPYSGSLVLFVAKDELRDRRLGRLLGWQSVAINDIMLIELPGNHRNLVSGNAREVAKSIARVLPD